MVGFVAGGGSDVFMRVIAKNLSVALNNPVIVDNYPGANANIAADKAAHSAPDGYTLMFASVPNAVDATLYEHLDYNFTKDLSPVIALASIQMVLTVPSSSEIHSLGDLISAAKAKPGQLSYSSGGIGSLEHLSGLQLSQAAGVELTHVPYKGSGASLTDLLGGRISFAFNSMPSVLANINAGKLRAIATADAQRSPWLPNTPTVAEAGVANFTPEKNWAAIVVPAGTPKPIIDRLNLELNKIIKLPDLKSLMSKTGAAPMGGTPEEFGKFESDEIAKYAQLIKRFGLRAD